MARAKATWRRYLNARYMRWRVLAAAVRLVPALGRRLAFFPDHVGLIEGADRVLADEAAPVPAAELLPHMDFLARCAPHDSTAPGLVLPGGAVTGRRTALFTRPWIDTVTGSILLPGRARTVLVRGAFANWNATSARLGRPRVRIEGRVFAPLPTANYFHLLVENGIRLLDLLDRGLVADRPLTVVKGPDRGAVEAALYRGIAALNPGVAVRHVPERALVEPDEAVGHFPPDTYWEWPPVDRAGAARLGEAFDRVYGAAARAAGPRRLWLSRRGAKLRGLANHAEVEAALARAGFESLIATDANHAEQIARFRAADTVVAVHGAGLANLLFAAPGTLVVEIFPGNFVKSTYWRLAQRLGLRYRPVVGGPGDYDQRFAVDADEVVAEVAAAGTDGG